MCHNENPGRKVSPTVGSDDCCQKPEYFHEVRDEKRSSIGFRKLEII